MQRLTLLWAYASVLLLLANQGEAAAPLGLPHKTVESPCYDGCSFKEKQATNWCPNDKPYVCGMKVGRYVKSTDDSGVTNLWIKCCGKTTESWEEVTVGGYIDPDIAIYQYTSQALYYTGMRSWYDTTGGIDGIGLLDIHGFSDGHSWNNATQHENNLNYPSNAKYVPTNSWCPTDHPYLCGARLFWELGPTNGPDDWGAISVEGKCCKVAPGYVCTKSEQCDQRNGKTTFCDKGICKCNSPWQNVDCSQCIDSRYDSTCSSSVICKTSRGTCNEGSCYGTSGNGICDTCLSTSYFGNTCSETVTCNTSNGFCNEGSCHGVNGNGECSSCKAGWAGANCQAKVTCSSYGGICLEGSCHGDGDGECTSCKPGFFGVDCLDTDLNTEVVSTSCPECSAAEESLVQQCPTTHPFVCQFRVGATQSNGVANAAMKCCNGAGGVYGGETTDSIASLSGSASQSTGEWSTKCTNFVSGLKYDPSASGFNKLELLCGLQHDNVDVPNPLLNGVASETVTCPSDKPYVCGIKHHWSTNAPLGTTQLDLHCCDIPREYKCNLDDQCNNELDDCVAGTCQQVCACKETSRWFKCKTDAPGCNLSNANDLDMCHSGPIESTTALYEADVNLSLKPFSPPGASTSQLEYYTALSAVARQVYCVGQPYLGAVTNTSVELLGISLTKLVANLDSTNIKNNLVNQPDGAVSGLVDVLNRIFARKIQSTTLYVNAPMVPAYSLERVLTIKYANPEAGFSVVDKWSNRKAAIATAIDKVTDDDEQFNSLCKILFEGLQSDTATERAIQTKNLQELHQRLQALFESVTYSKDSFVDLQKGAADSATALNEAVDVMQTKIEEFEKAKLAANLFDAIVQVVVTLCTLIVSAATTFFTAGAFSPTLAGTDTSLLDSIKPLNEVAEGVGTIINAVEGVDEPEILRLDSFDIGVDAAGFVRSNEMFRDNAVAVSKELLALGKILEQLLSQDASDPEAFQEADSKGSIMDPQVWDLINLQLIASLESMRICEPPEIRLNRRRLVTPGYLRITNGESSGLELRRIGGDTETKSVGRSLKSKAAKADRLYEETKDSINDMTRKCELFKIEWEKVTNAGKMLHTDIAGMVSLFRDIRVTSYAVNAYKKNAENWTKKQNQGCGNVDTDAHIAILQSQLDVAHVMEAEDLYSAQQRLWDTCETVQYVLNPDTQACDREKVFSLRSISAVKAEWENTKAKFIDAWRDATSFEDVTYKKIDISNFVNMNALRNWDGLESPPVLEFTLTPDMIAENEKVDTRCNYNVEVSEMAVVFQGTKEKVLYGTSVEMMGPFVKESKEGNAKVFIPTHRYKLGFKYKVGDMESACETSASSFSKLCGKQLCAESGGDNIQWKESGNVPLPSLFSRYRIEVESFGSETMFRDVNAVHLLFRGRFRKKDGDCPGVVEECSWATSVVEANGTSPDIALIIGVSVAGAVVAIGAGVLLLKATWKNSVPPLAVEVNQEVTANSDMVVENPRFNLNDL